MNIFIGCGKRKNSTSCKAENMYLGNFFSTCLEYAKTLNGHIYILSAKYGILELDKVITPYDKTLNSINNDEKSLWADMVKSQIVEKNIDTTEETVFLCGKNYYSELLELFEHTKLPLDGLTGMGYQIQWMKSKLNKKRKLF